MTNKDLWELHVKHDLDQAEKLIQKGYTETTEFIEKVEALYSSLEYFLREVDELKK